MSRTFFILIILSILGLAACGGDTPAITDVPVTDTIPTVPVEPASAAKSEILARYEKMDEHLVIDWQSLAKVVFEDRFNDDVQGMVAYPIFHDDVKALEGEKVQISGYVIPVTQDDGKLHVISAYPFSSCFFCGGAGPESVMDVKTIKSHEAFKMDQILTFRGTLKLNDSDINFLNYMLDDAVWMKDLEGFGKEKFPTPKPPEPSRIKEDGTVGH